MRIDHETHGFQLWISGLSDKEEETMAEYQIDVIPGGKTVTFKTRRPLADTKGAGSHTTAAGRKQAVAKYTNYATTAEPCIA